MKPVHLLAAATAATMLAGALSATVPLAAAAAGDVPALCPDTTHDSTYLGGDDFDPNTPREANWDKVGNWSSVQDGAEWIAHGEIPGEGAATEATMAGLTLPNKASVLTLKHAHVLGDDEQPGQDEAHLEVVAGGTTSPLDKFTGVSDGAQVKAYDLTPFAGQQVRLQVRVTAGSAPTGAAAAGWSLYDVSVDSCNPPSAPSAPRSVTAVGGLGNATLKWAAPADPGKPPLSHYRITVQPDGQDFEVGPETTSKLITGLPSGVTQTFSVRAVNQHGESAQVTKKLVGTRIAVSSPSTIVYGSSAVIKGRAYRTDTGATVTGLTVKLQGRKKGATTWSSVTSMKTGSGGIFSFTRKPTANYQYRVVYTSGYSNYLGSASSTRTVNVRTKVSAAWSDSSIRVGQKSYWTGTVSPNHRGQIAYMQVHDANGWHNLFEMTLNSESKYRGYIQPSPEARGTWYFRTYMPGDADHYAGYSPARKIVIS